ncbi:hypothetical protein [Metabacillus sp. RGM 3146]|uniref:hypothetical protein n=1 Tax=Metabacillus sp. RGM 3146 TaxID=3401092 RepID=UPI003B9C1315
MDILSRKKIVSEKVERIKKGYSAYAESAEMAQMLKKELGILELKVYEDITEFGSWFIPETVNE